jgi:hypothetical protein
MEQLEIDFNSYCYEYLADNNRWYPCQIKEVINDHTVWIVAEHIGCWVPMQNIRRFKEVS